jgi:hypothetical protein
MKHRITSLAVEMVGSAAVCGFAYLAEVLIASHRRAAGRI